jgi:hypothetical protein
MNTRYSFIGILGSLLLGAACASGGATTTSGARPEARMGNEGSETLIRRLSCSSTNTVAAPANGLIADFSSQRDGGGVAGKLVTALPPDSPSSSAMTHTTDGGKLTINVNAPATTKPQVLTTSLMFDGCVDASGYTGVQFDIRGSLSGCGLTYATVDPEHQYYQPEGPYPPQTKISPAELTSTSRSIKAPFQGSAIQGNPSTPTDASKLAFVQWLVLVPVGADDGTAVPPCTGNLVIDDVKLYR